MKWSSAYGILLPAISFLMIAPNIALKSKSKSKPVSENEVGVESSSEPVFLAPIKNISVPVGKEAVLHCVVDNLGQYKVGWIHTDSQTILTLHRRVITHNTRISVTHDDLRTWSLHIKQVEPEDRGCYMCQLNTNEMKKRIGCIDVHVPPDIIASETSVTTSVQEGNNVKLSCKAEGHPKPRIVWRREDGKPISLRPGLKGHHQSQTVEGERLEIMKVDRTQSGAYWCIASNDVPPAVSKRILLHVNFHPEVSVDQQLVGVPLGSNVTLFCRIQAYPKPISYWLKHNTEMVIPTPRKYIVEEEQPPGGKDYERLLRLTILNFDENDDAQYQCASQNTLGKMEKKIRVHGTSSPQSYDATVNIRLDGSASSSTALSMNALLISFVGLNFMFKFL